MYTKESGVNQSFAFCGWYLRNRQKRIMEDSIMVAKNEIACLDNLSLEGDIPEDVLDTEDDL